MKKKILASFLFLLAFSMLYHGGFQLGYLDNIQVANNIRLYRSHVFERNPADVLGYSDIVLAQGLIQIGLWILFGLAFWLLARRRKAIPYTVAAGFVAFFILLRFSFFSSWINWVSSLIKIPFKGVTDSFYYFMVTGVLFVFASVLLGAGAMRLTSTRHRTSPTIGPHSA